MLKEEQKLIKGCFPLEGIFRKVWNFRLLRMEVEIQTMS